MEESSRAFHFPRHCQGPAAFAYAFSETSAHPFDGGFTDGGSPVTRDRRGVLAADYQGTLRIGGTGAAVGDNHPGSGCVSEKTP